VDGTIAKHGVLDPAEGNAGKAEPDMGAARDGDATAVRNDLHQRLPRHRKLLDAECITRTLELPLQISFREIARRQVSHNKVAVAEIAPSNRPLIGERVALVYSQVDGFIPQMGHGTAPSWQSISNNTDIQLPAPHGRDEFRRTCLAELKPGAWPVSPECAEEFRQKPDGQWPEDADPEMTVGVGLGARTFKGGSELISPETHLV
jgi:hypothetical protein